MSQQTTKDHRGMSREQQTDRLRSLFDQVQTIPSDIRDYLEKIAQAGWHPDRVKDSYIQVRDYLNGGKASTCNVSTEWVIELPTEPPEISNLYDPIGSGRGTAIDYAPPCSAPGYPLEPGHGQTTRGMESVQNTLIQNQSDTFISPVSMASVPDATFTPAPPNFGTWPGVYTPASSFPDFHGQYPSPDLATLDTQHTGTLNGLGIFHPGQDIPVKQTMIAQMTVPSPSQSQFPSTIRRSSTSQPPTEPYLPQPGKRSGQKASKVTKAVPPTRYAKRPNRSSLYTEAQLAEIQGLASPPSQITPNTGFPTMPSAAPLYRTPQQSPQQVSEPFSRFSPPMSVPATQGPIRTSQPTRRPSSSTQEHLAQMMRFPHYPPSSR